jgi:hypothetical protein
MKFHIIPNACSSEIIQSYILKILKKPCLLVTPPAHPSFLTILCRISTTINLSLQSMRESRLLSYLCSFLMTVQTFKMLLQVPELARGKWFARCQEIWQNQCRRGISTEKKRCTTWRHGPYANTTTTIYMTATLIFKIACVILSCFLQR